MPRNGKSPELRVVIMCGGSGTRFWPASRRRTPKQFLRLGTKSSLIQQTVARLEGFVEPDHIHLLAGTEHQDLLRRHLPQITNENYILEPSPRNTAPALALAARVLEEAHPGAVLAALPSDHAIADVNAFHRCLAQAARAAAERGVIATLGVQPDYPEVGYGYIEVGEEIISGLRIVKRFVEKPSLELAGEYLASGNFLWNSGMFVMRSDTLGDKFVAHQPQIHKIIWEQLPSPGARNFSDRLGEAYPRLPAISIDYAILEKSAEGVVCVPADIGWNDLGSWIALEKLWGVDKPGNAANDRYYAIDSSGNIISRASLEVALIGVHDLVVVERNDVVLICDKSRCQELREMIELLEREGREDLL